MSCSLPKVERSFKEKPKKSHGQTDVTGIHYPTYRKVCLQERARDGDFFLDVVNT